MVGRYPCSCSHVVAAHVVAAHPCSASAGRRHQRVPRQYGPWRLNFTACPSRLAEPRVQVAPPGYRPAVQNGPDLPPRVPVPTTAGNECSTHGSACNGHSCIGRRGPPRPSPAPFKDWLQQVEAYAGEAHRAPEAFLAQFYLYAMQNNVPAAERTRHWQLIGKLTGAAQTWYTLAFANDPSAATEAQIVLGLRKAFGQEYAGERALLAMFHVTPQPTQGGHQRLLGLYQREKQARQHRVPRNADPNEHRFSQASLVSLIPSSASSMPTPTARRRPSAMGGTFLPPSQAGGGGPPADSGPGC
jgi:hypothetical protein